MQEALNRNVFLVKEHVGAFKAANNFDIHDPETGELVLMCREEDLGILTKLLRFSDYKRHTPFNVRVVTPTGEQVVRVTRGTAFIQSKVRVLDESNEYIGGFKQKVFSVGGAFDVLDEAGRVLCSLRGKWTGWDFRFEAGGSELARVTKKWAGVGKELLTSADNYVLQISDAVPAGNQVRLLILAAVLCIDMVLKE